MPNMLHGFVTQSCGRIGVEVLKCNWRKSATSDTLIIRTTGFWNDRYYTSTLYARSGTVPEIADLVAKHFARKIEPYVNAP